MSFLKFTSRNQVVPTEKGVEESTLLTTLWIATLTNFWGLHDLCVALLRECNGHIALHRTRRPVFGATGGLSTSSFSSWIAAFGVPCRATLRLVPCTSHARTRMDRRVRTSNPITTRPTSQRLHNRGRPARCRSDRTRWVDWDLRAFDWREVSNRTRRTAGSPSGSLARGIDTRGRDISEHIGRIRSSSRAWKELFRTKEGRKGCWKSWRGARIGRKDCEGSERRGREADPREATGWKSCPRIPDTSSIAKESRGSASSCCTQKGTGNSRRNSKSYWRASPSRPAGRISRRKDGAHH